MCKRDPLVGSGSRQSTNSSSFVPGQTRSLPEYLQENYWWACMHPKGVRVFERQWLVNLILCGNFGQLRDSALDELGATISGRTLQVAAFTAIFR
jgi:hypothetical protein